MKDLYIETLLILSCLTSCVKGTSVATVKEDLDGDINCDSLVTVEEDPYKDVPPLINGDSLVKVYPLALEGNIIQKEEFEKAMRKEILSHVGKHMECLEILPWKVSSIDKYDDDYFYVTFERAVPSGGISILTKLSRDSAANLSKYEWYEVCGIFTGFPYSESFQPHISSHEIRLGVLELDSTSVNVYPKEKRSYWENYGVEDSE